MFFFNGCFFGAFVCVRRLGVLSYVRSKKQESILSQLLDEGDMVIFVRRGASRQIRLRFVCLVVFCLFFTHGNIKSTIKTTTILGEYFLFFQAS